MVDGVFAVINTYLYAPSSRETNGILSLTIALLLFVDGRPMAMRSGMASVSQIDMFLEEHLPRDEEEKEECVNEIDLQGEMILCSNE